jgi:hypothetical protein
MPDLVGQRLVRPDGVAEDEAYDGPGMILCPSVRLVSMPGDDVSIPLPAATPRRP